MNRTPTPEYVRDNKFKCFMQERLDKKIYDVLIREHNSTAYETQKDVTFLTTIAVTKSGSRDSMLNLVEQFLGDLPMEEAQAYVGDTGTLGYPVIWMCCDMKMLEIIIKYVVDVNVCDDEETNVLGHMYRHLGELCWPGYGLKCLEKTKFFLDRGVNVNASDEYGMTPLMLLCARYAHCSSKEHIDEILELLIFSGADVEAKSLCGTAYDCVQNCDLLSNRMSALLLGTIKMNCPKNANSV